MRKWAWGLAAAIALSGCDQLQGKWQSLGGGGGSAGAPQDTASEAPGRDPQLTRDRLGDALVAAARAHRAIAIGRMDVARVALRDLRAALAGAGPNATLDQQRSLNQLEAAAIEVEGFVERGAPDAGPASATLVQRLLGQFDGIASVPATTGGGGGPAAPVATSTAPAPQELPTPKPSASFDDLNSNQLLENKP